MQVTFLVNCKVLHKHDYEWEVVSLTAPIWVIRTAMYS